MRYRRDYVTNSSATSYLLAQKGSLTQKQKEAVAKWVEEKVLGEIILAPEVDKGKLEVFLEEGYFDDEVKEEARRAHEEGFSLKLGWVPFNEGKLDDLYQSLWKALEDAEKENFQILDGDLID